MLDATSFEPEISMLEDYAAFSSWRNTHRPTMTKSVQMAFGAEKTASKESEGDTIRKVLNLLETHMQAGQIDLPTFEKFREMGEAALQRLEGGQAGAQHLAKAIVQGYREGKLSYTETHGTSRILQNLRGQVSADYFNFWHR